MRLPTSQAPGPKNSEAAYRWSAHLEVHRLLALDDSDKVAGDDATLVDELVKGVLPVGARLSKVDLPGFEG